MSIGSFAIVVEGDDCKVSNVVIGPGTGMGAVATIGAKRFKGKNIHVDTRSLASFAKVGPNARCPCKSGRKFKHCHGGGGKVEKKSAGIMSIGSSGDFTDTTVITEAGGTAIYRENDQTNFNRTTVIVGGEVDFKALIAALKLPEDPPVEFVEEAAKLVAETRGTDVLQYSKLRLWLMERGLDKDFWAGAVVAIGKAVLGGLG